MHVVERNSWGHQLRRRREQFQLRPDEVADLAALEPARLAEIEGGDDRLSTTELEGLGRALAFDPAELVIQGELANPKKLSGWFLSHAGSETETDISGAGLRLVLLARELGLIGKFLLNEIHGREPQIWNFVQPKGLEADVEAQGRELGATAHRMLVAESGAIPSVQGLLEDLDVHVVALPLPGLDKLAMTVAERGCVPVVLVNEEQAKTRPVGARRMLLAHELAHLLHDGGHTSLGGVPQDRFDDVEKRAKNFAPSFLAPQDKLSYEGTGTAAELTYRIAREWGMSLQAAFYHSKNIGMHTTEHWEDVRHEVASLRPPGGMDVTRWEPCRERRVPEEFDVEANPHQLVNGYLQDVVLEAVRRCVISAGRAREILELR